jgi:hypothetical protein
MTDVDDLTDLIDGPFPQEVADTIARRILDAGWRDYSCRGPIFVEQIQAEVAMRHNAAGQRLQETPYTYRCVEGHWHYDARADR